MAEGRRSVDIMKPPPLLKLLLENNQWKHPGEDIIRSVVPFIEDPLVFLETQPYLDFESGCLMSDHEDFNDRFHEYRGSKIAERQLPWIDIEKTIHVAVNEKIGDDVCISLDLRTSEIDPRVVGSEWSDDACYYREISNTFSDFCNLIGINTEQEH